MTLPRECGYARNYPSSIKIEDALRDLSAHCPKLFHRYEVADVSLRSAGFVTVTGFYTPSQPEAAELAELFRLAEQGSAA